ncbi:MAG TPA: 50S ribosomal protein L18 [Patescibacteria group bacterium]|nr:50S ribosomal protein L18 [Patescibacteria group bacterium]
MQKISKRQKRKRRIRAKIFGTAKMPRVSVFRSNKFLYLQAINDEKGMTLAATSNLKTKEKFLENFAKKLQDQKIKRIVFDRGGYQYHGNIKKIAEGLRKLGLEF